MVKSSSAAAFSIIMAVAVFCKAQELKCPFQSLYQFRDSSDTGALHKIKYPIESLYQFGDSFSDTGNYVRMFPTSFTARPPYGKTFPGYPTGRMSDGRLIVDYIAMAFGLPLLKPYMDKTASFSNGVNYAVAGGRALNDSFYSEKNMTLSVVPSIDGQLRLFKTYLNSKCSTQADCRHKLRKSVVFAGEIGYNDIGSATNGRPIEEIRTYVPLVVEVITNTIRELVEAGFSQVVVPGVFPIGCSPFAISVFSSNKSTQYDEFGCVKSVNNLSISLNNQLQKALDSLQKKIPNAVILYADYYDAFQTLLRKASFLGFNTSTLLKPCCGYARSITCGNPAAPVCPNPNTYIHWDGAHLTQEANHRISEIIIEDLKIKCSRHIKNSLKDSNF